MQNSKSKAFPLVDGCADRSTPWPDNIDGFVVTKQLENFILAEAAQQIAISEHLDLNWQLIRFVASEDRSEGYQRVIGAMIRAIKQGSEGITAVRSTAMHVMDFGFDYMTSYGSELIYEEGVERMRQSAGRLD